MKTITKKNLFFSILVINLLSIHGISQAGSFVFAREDPIIGTGAITHPPGYTGAGGILNIKVCIRPTSSFTANLEQATKNSIATWNEQKPTSSNLLNNLPDFNSIDAESVIVHEMGHCIGLAHPNLAVGGVSGIDRNYSSTTNGTDNIYNLDPGADGIRGSTDDIRGDDDNLHWFRISNNNPFSIASIIDSTTYSLDIVDLPSSHTSVANGDRLVSTLFSAPNSESVMQQESFNNEVQRTLTHDDVATLQLARSGLDTTAGNADDYNINLTYGGISAASDCNINLGFDNTKTGFAACEVSGTFLTEAPDRHISLFSTEIYLNDSINWHYNTDTPCSESTTVTENQWKMISLPCQVGISTSATVEGQFGDDLDVTTYGTNWGIWSYNPVTNSYVALSLSDELEEGVGYWFLSLTTSTIDIEGQYNTNIDVPLAADITTGKWNMIGSPFRLPTAWNTVKLVNSDGTLLDLTDADPVIGGSTACEDPIDISCSMASTAFSFNGTSYDALTPTTGNLDPFDAAWVLVYKSGLALRLQMNASELTAQ
ncbi:MAG: hypothetical protein L3J59_04425 [Methylococcaceae bacterium]|nr:hypothetical protein [Methylococcaceae bacterium]